MGSKYIVRQPIKDAAGEILGYEILYHGENQAFIGDAGAANEFAAADTIYNFLTQNSTKSLKGSLNFMTFTTMLLMKKTPRLFDKSELVIQIDDSVIIHPLSMHFVNQYAREGYKIAANEFQFAPRYLTLLDSLDYIKLNSKTTTDAAMQILLTLRTVCTKSALSRILRRRNSTKRRWRWVRMRWRELMSQRSSRQRLIAGRIFKAIFSA